MWRPLVLITALAAGPAFAECPVPADMQTGIRVEYSDGLVEIVRSAGDDIVELVGVEGREAIYRMELAHGLHVLSYVAFDGGRPDAESAMSYDFGMPAAEMPVPAPSQRWDTAALVTTGSEPPVETAQSSVFGPVESLSVGECRFASIEVMTAFDTDDNYIETIKYLPELGFGWLVTMNDETSGFSAYSAVSIAPIRPGDWPMNK
ncbi:hypothetical protein ACXN5S_17655 [Pseudoroseicyclus sp. H15]